MAERVGLVLLKGGYVPSLSPGIRPLAEALRAGGRVCNIHSGFILQQTRVNVLGRVVPIAVCLMVFARLLIFRVEAGPVVGLSRSIAFI